MSPASQYVFKKLLKIGLYGVLFILLVLNIAASQFLPTSYFSFVEGDRASAVELLKAVKFLPEFTILADRQREIYGENIDSELFTTEKNRAIKIMHLEQLLAEYPKSRDILYGLSVLYADEGNTEKAQMYMKKAQAIDPMAGKL
jgi:tetratricopeptide (TPR) repeat protein